MDTRNWIQRLLGFCPWCGRWFRRVELRRQDTSYQDDALNWFVGCGDCQEAHARFWEGLWEQLKREE